MKIFSAYIILLFFIHLQLQAQVNDGTSPLSWSLNVSGPPPQLILPTPDKEALLRQDEQELGGPYRFGVEIKNEIFLDDFEQIPVDGGKLYRLGIISPGALSLNLNFSRFVIKPGTRMWVYDPSKNYKIGGFNWRNVNKHFNFATVPLPVDNLIVELFEPTENVATSDIEISGVVTGYRPLIAEKAGFGQSGACNVNINCDIASGWENERQAVVMLLTANNTRKCTGTLINNTAQDGTPYVLTAKHCNTATNAIFMFNYQSPDCTNIDGPTNQVLQGCEIVAENTFSDFTLLKLDQNPLPDFNPYFAGWSRSNVPSPMSYCIHHPRGDIKKFSVDSNAVISSGYINQSSSLNNHWQVLDWDIGTTEAGSSGSPLFNEQHQIVGQLHGGYASCYNNLSDYFGRFDVSWQYGQTPNSRLKEWLDPYNTDSLSMPGMYFYVPFYNRDVKISQIIQPEPVICDSVISPKISVVSLGSDTVTSITIKYGIGDEMLAYVWNGNLQFMQQAIIELPQILISEVSNYLFTVKIEEVNMQADENIGNDSLSKSFEKVVGKPYLIQFTTDAYPQENQITITGEGGEVIFNANSFQPNQLNEYKLCLKPGCYTVTLTDSYGDGICCEHGSGLFVIKEEHGNLVAKIFILTDSITFDFCTPIYHFTNELFTIYPNPAATSCTLLVNPSIQNDDLELSVFELNGKLKYQQTFTGDYYHSFYLNGFSAGVYVIVLRDKTAGKIWKEKLIILNH